VALFAGPTQLKILVQQIMISHYATGGSLSDFSK